MEVTTRGTILNVTESHISDLIPTTPNLVSIATELHNISLINGSEEIPTDSQFVEPLFEGFLVTEIVMTALELLIAFIASFKIPGWKENYRNQMLMQISVARFIKRVFSYVKYLKDKGIIESSLGLRITILSSQIYVDYVLAILVCFFIKHMYESLIIVIVRISRESLYRILLCSWLVPVPITALFTFITVRELLDKWTSYLLICCVFRWPLMFLSTILYFVILYKVLRDDIRRFARILTIVTFVLCLIVNFYLLFGDIIKLWCLNSFTTVLVKYISGFCLNTLALCLYFTLIALNYHSNRKANNSYADRSNANVIDE